MGLYTLLMLSREVSYEDGDPGIEDFEIFTSIEKAKAYAEAMEWAEWEQIDQSEKFASLKWTQSGNTTSTGPNADTYDFDSSYLGYHYTITWTILNPTWPS